MFFKVLYIDSKNLETLPYKQIILNKSLNIIASGFETFEHGHDHECVLTNTTRSRLGLTQSNMCPLGEEKEESLFHLFRDCHSFVIVWHYFIRVDNYDAFYFADD